MLTTGETHMTQRHAMHCVQRNKHSIDARTEPCIRGDKKQRQEKENKQPPKREEERKRTGKQLEKSSRVKGDTKKAGVPWLHPPLWRRSW